MDESLRDSISRKVVPIVAAHAKVQGLYLFGSLARGDHHKASDVDLGVLFEYPYQASLDEVIRLEHEFEETLGWPVDLIDVGHCDPFLALDVIQGERLYERDGAACDEFDLYVMRRAGDLAPFQEERWRMMMDWARGA